MLTIAYYSSRLWYYGTLIYYGKHSRSSKTNKLWFIMDKKNYGNIIKVLNKFIAVELWFTMENYGTCGKTIGIMKKK